MIRVRRAHEKCGSKDKQKGTHRRRRVLVLNNKFASGDGDLCTDGTLVYLQTQQRGEFCTSSKFSTSPGVYTREDSKHERERLQGRILVQPSRPSSVTVSVVAFHLRLCVGCELHR